MNSRDRKAAKAKLQLRYAAMAEPLFGVEPERIEPQPQRTARTPVSDEQIVQFFNECRRSHVVNA